MEKLNLSTAISQAKEKGVKVLKKELAAKLWPNSKEITQQVNMSSLISGRTSRISLDMIHVICHELKCTPNLLFNIFE